MIYQFASQLNGKEEIMEQLPKSGRKPKQGFCFFHYVPFFIEDKAYKLVWLLEKNRKNYIGVINCYRRSKYDKK